MLMSTNPGMIRLSEKRICSWPCDHQFFGNKCLENGTNWVMLLQAIKTNDTQPQSDDLECP